MRAKFPASYAACARDLFAADRWTDHNFVATMQGRHNGLDVGDESRRFREETLIESFFWLPSRIRTKTPAADMDGCALRCRAIIGDERNELVPPDQRIELHIGGPRRRYYCGNIFGGGVNAAARLEGIEAPSGICISGDVSGQVRNRGRHCFRRSREHCCLF